MAAQPDPQTSGFIESWNKWHATREASMTAPLGTASLTATNWVDPVPATLPGLPGRWSRDGEHIVGEGISKEDVTTPDGSPSTLNFAQLHPGEEFSYLGSLFRVINRDGVPALRQYDSEAVRLKNIDGIDAWEPDASWVLSAEFTYNDIGAKVTVNSIDGYVSEEEPSGWLSFEKDGEQVQRLPVLGSRNRPMLVFNDSTNGAESYRFRFLILDGMDGAQPRVDFNRAYLPPCAVSSSYFCPLPQSENKLSFAVRAGERAIRHSEGSRV